MALNQPDALAAPGSSSSRPPLSYSAPRLRALSPLACPPDSQLRGASPAPDPSSHSPEFAAAQPTPNNPTSTPPSPPVVQGGSEIMFANALRDIVAEVRNISHGITTEFAETRKLLLAPSPKRSKGKEHGNFTTPSPPRPRSIAHTEFLVRFRSFKNTSSYSLGFCSASYTNRDERVAWDNPGYWDCRHCGQ